MTDAAPPPTEKDELLQKAALAALAKNTRSAAVYSVLGGIIVLAALAGSAWQVADLQKQRGVLETDIEKRRTKISELQKTEQALLDRIEALKSANVLANQQIGRKEFTDAQATLKASVETPAPLVSAAEQARVSVGRIYFQARSEAQVALYKRCAPVLVTAGYRVPGVQRVTIGPRRTELRYFHAEEEAAAQKLKGELESCLGQPVALSRPTYSGINPLHFEVWMGPPV